METVKSFAVNEVSEIQIESSLSQVNVMPGNSKDIVLRWTDTKRRTTKSVLDGKTLSVKDHASVALYGVVGLIWLKEDKELTLEIPPEFCGSIRIKSRDECVRILGVNSPSARYGLFRQQNNANSFPNRQYYCGIRR